MDMKFRLDTTTEKKSYLFMLLQFTCERRRWVAAIKPMTLLRDDVSLEGLEGGWMRDLGTGNGERRENLRGKIL